MLKTGLKIDHERFLLVGKNLSSESEKTVKNKIDISTLVRTQEDFHFVYIHLFFVFTFFFNLRDWICQKGGTARRLDSGEF